MRPSPHRSPRLSSLRRVVLGIALVGLLSSGFGGCATAQAGSGVAAQAGSGVAAQAASGVVAQAGSGFATQAGSGVTAVALAPGVYVVHGQPGSADEHNLGRIGNAGFIVGPRGVVAIDTGTSYAHGQALLAAIARVTPLPVRVALVSHTRPEFLFGG